MKTWIKKDISKETVRELSKKYGIDTLAASIFARRGITEGKDLLFYLEDDLRFLHNPFLFNQMEDAADRILDAKDEGEKVLIFGDRDVDGITSTTILYEYLLSLGMDVQYKVPLGDETYGLSIEAVDEFAANFGTLIITVDCGITNIAEIKYASEKGIDVIVTDHHNVQETLPDPAIIINPKMPDTAYPFADISGCAVTFKLIQALRFAQTELYKQDICLLSAAKTDGAYKIECIKMHNAIEKDRFSLENIKGPLKISGCGLDVFLRGQQIFTWNDKETKAILRELFGTSVEFNTFDLRPEAAKIIPSLKNLSLEQLNSKSKIARYTQSFAADSFANIFITYICQKQNELNPGKANLENRELQLVALAALADVMPLENENRIFVKHALKTINDGTIRDGIAELLSHLSLLNKRITSTDLSWSIIPALNSTGRLGHPELAIRLLTEQDAAKRNQTAAEIIELNTERKALVNTAQEYVSFSAEISFQKYKNFCFIIDKRINRGVIGLIAARLNQKYKVPAVVITFIDENTAVGSMRSSGEFDCTEFLSQFENRFINYGGHTNAAGFSMTKESLGLLQNEIDSAIEKIHLKESGENEILIDAELPPSCLTPEFFKIIDVFEPYGEKSAVLTFMTKNVKIASYQIVGKTERQHLKLTLDTGNHKVPVMYWNAADKIGADFSAGDTINFVYKIERNVYNGMENFQLTVLDIQKQDIQK